MLNNESGNLKSADEMRRLGIFLICFSAFCFSAMQVLIRKTVAIPVLEQIFFRNIVNFVMVAAIIYAQKGSFFGERKYQPLLFFRSIMGFLGLLSMFYAAGRGNQADISILLKLSPFMISILAYYFLKEKLEKAQVAALFIAFIGAGFVANPAFNTSLLPLFMAVLCSVFSSVSYTLLAYFKNKVDGMTIIAHFSAFCVVASIPFLINSFVVPSLEEFILLILIGVFGGVGQIALTYSYRMAPAGEISIYNYSGIIFSMALAFVFLGEGLKWNSITGGALVIGASILAYIGRKKPHDVDDVKVEK